MIPDKEKKLEVPQSSQGSYTCHRCGLTSSSPLTGHSCWQSSPKAYEGERRIARKIEEEQS